MVVVVVVVVGGVGVVGVGFGVGGGGGSDIESFGMDNELASFITPTKDDSV